MSEESMLADAYEWEELCKRVGGSMQMSRIDAWQSKKLNRDNYAGIVLSLLGMESSSKV